MKRAKVVYLKDKRGKWRFRLVAANGEILMVSQGYVRRKDAAHGAGAIARTLLNLRARGELELHP